MSCEEISLTGFDKCLSIKFSYLQEYAGLKAVGSPNVLVGTLYQKDGKEKPYSRVSASMGDYDSKLFLYVSFYHVLPPFGNDTANAYRLSKIEHLILPNNNSRNLPYKSKFFKSKFFSI